MKSFKKIAALFITVSITVNLCLSLPVIAENKGNDMNISDLTIETHNDPIGLSPELAPRFEWKLQSSLRGEGQSAYSVKVGTTENGADMWDTGWVYASDQHVEYDGLALEDQTKYYVTLSVKDINGVECEHKMATFETGIREDNWEDAAWIGWKNTKRLRKVISVSAPVKQARAYIAGFGYYELSINGKKVGESVLESPAGKDRARYATFDVTDMLEQGDNCLGIMLGAAYEHDKNRHARMILAITYQDGTADTVVTDDTWSASDISEVVSDSIYNGERYDARIDDGWKLAEYSETDEWHQAETGSDTAKMDAQVQDIQVMDSYAPVSVTDRGNGVYIVDAGENRTGWLALKDLNGEAGQTITMRYAEMLYDDGSLDDTSMRRTTQNKYTMAGKPGEGYKPKFFFTTFRYVEITGFPGVPDADNFEIHRVYSNMPTIGKFSSSDELLNKISDAYFRTQTSCMISVPMDSAQREKHGWLGDAHVTGESTHYYLDAASFYDKWMYDIADQMVRSGNTGFMNLQVPDYGQSTGPDGGYGGGDICWTYAVFSIPWDTYRATGDATYLSRHYDIMKSHLQWWINKGGGKTMHWDWVGLDKNKMTAQMFADAYYCRSIELMMNIANAVGETEDEEMYRGLYEQEKDKFNRKWYKDGYYDTNKQAANATALAFGLVEEENAQSLIENIEKNLFVENSGHLTTGVMGTKNIMDAMIKYHRPDIAYRINSEKTYPSLGYMIESGSTTLWEYWQHIHCDEDPERYPGQFMPTIGSAWMSQSHCFLGGGFGTWVFRGLCGISPKTPGYETVSVAPQIPLDLERASASVETVRGSVSSEWERDEDNQLTLKVTIPTGSKGEVAIPVRGEISNVTITEGEDTLYEMGENYDTEFIRWVENTDDAIVFEVASGEYVFNMNGNGEYPYEKEENYDYTFNSFEKIAAVKEVTDKSVTLGVSKTKSNKADYAVIAALYKNNNLTDVEFVKSEDIEDDTSLTLDFPQQGEEFELRLMVWDSLNGAMPLSSVKTKSIFRKYIGSFTVGGIEADIDDKNRVISVTIPSVSEPAAAYVLNNADATLSIGQNEIVTDGQEIVYTDSGQSITYTLNLDIVKMTELELPEGSVLKETADIENSESSGDWTIKNAVVEETPYGIDGYAYTVSNANESVEYNFANKLGKNSAATLRFYSAVVGHNVRYGFKYVDDNGEHTVQIGGNVAKVLPQNKAYNLFFDNNVNRYNKTGTGILQSVGWHEFAVKADGNGTLIFYIDGERILADGEKFSKSLGENGYISGICVNDPGWFTGSDYLSGAITDIRLFEIPAAEEDARGIKTFSICGVNAAIDEEDGTITASVSEILKPVAEYTLKNDVGEIDIEQGSEVFDGQVITYTNGSFTKTYTINLTKRPFAGQEWSPANELTTTTRMVDYKDAIKLIF